MAEKRQRKADTVTPQGADEALPPLPGRVPISESDKDAAERHVEAILTDALKLEEEADG